ncbi:P-loop containing nucleoside triphosphate hydrolase protein [Plectosphaerella plurivora]|uniref:P-loop containing nucleoside triphosphate hydrolase protein n=1 Tax=Plectosphaerella plurivora TaxID=936078 RepID=A0A9P8V748_9PEZI|nr:P-loop containing nucleoside triphosphate hydrolase protein [Plectosphaerella plurivora]
MAALYFKSSRAQTAIVQDFADDPADAFIGPYQPHLVANLATERVKHGNSYIGVIVDIPLDDPTQSANEGTGFGVRHTHDSLTKKVVESNIHRVTVKFPRGGYTLKVEPSDGDWKSSELPTMSFVTVTLAPGVTTTIKGLGMPYVNINKALDSFVNRNALLGRSHLTLEQLVSQKVIKLVVKGTPDSIASEFSEDTLPEPFNYPYGDDHSFSVDRFSKILNTAASATTFTPAFSFEDDNSQVAVTAHLNVQDALWLATEVSQIAALKKHVYFIPIDDRRGPNLRASELFVIMPSAQDILFGKHKSAWSRLTKEGGFHLATDANIGQVKCAAIFLDAQLDELARKVDSANWFTTNAPPTSTIFGPLDSAIVKDRQALHRAVMRGNGFHTWMATDEPQPDSASPQDSSITEITNGLQQAAITKTSKLRSIPIVDFTDVPNQSYLQSTLMELLPQDRERAMTYFRERHLGIGLFTAGPGFGKTTMISIAALIMQNKLGPVLVSAPSNVAVDNFAERINRLSSSIVCRHNEDLEEDSPERASLRTVIRVYKYRNERQAFRHLLLHPADLSNAVSSYRNSWGTPPKWKFELSLAYWLLTVFRATEVPGIEPIGPDHSAALRTFQAEVDKRAELAPFRAFAAAAGSSTAGRSALNDGVLNRLFNELIRIADFVATTPAASSTGGKNGVYGFKHNRAQGLVVDEAGAMNRGDLACVWGNVLTPCFLAGDPKQLPPTILTGEFERDMSGNLRNRLAGDGEISPLLFLQASGIPVFRMHVQLRIARGLFDIVAEQVYPGVPFTYADVCNITEPRFAPGHLLEEFVQETYPSIKPPEEHHFSPVFIHCPDTEVITSSSGSKRSDDQVIAALQFIADLVKAKNIDPSRIAMIATYSANVDSIERTRQQRKLDFGFLDTMPRAYTVDGFQGQEADIVIVVMGTNRQTGAGFTSDPQRLNVLLTRARAGLVLVGDITTMGGRHPTPGQDVTFIMNLHTALCRQGRVANIEALQAQR